MPHKPEIVSEVQRLGGLPVPRAGAQRSYCRARAMGRSCPSSSGTGVHSQRRRECAPQLGEEGQERPSPPWPSSSDTPFPVTPPRTIGSHQALDLRAVSYLLWGTSFLQDMG